MRIKSAEFVISNTRVDKCPKTGFPEYAFIGRSNVGKSSLINAITNNKNLAKTSSKPGKTQLINHFLINNHWYLVDLPGYGYAKTSKTQRAKFQKFISNYFLERRELIASFVLVDSRHEPQKIDLEFMEFLAENQIPFSIVFTKTDKVKQNQLDKNLSKYRKVMKAVGWEELPPIFLTSSQSKKGLDDILDYIGSINEEIAQNQS